MPKRILVFSASVGGGHLRAAEAVETALRQLDPEAEITNTDVLELTNAAFRRFYARAYLDLVNRAPYVLGYLYDLLDRTPSPQRKSDRLRLALEKINLTRFTRFLREHPADVIVNTHYLPAEIIASLKRSGKLDTPQMTVTTDFATHRLWINQPCEHYFTATEEGAAYLAHWGAPPEDVAVSGIPVHPAFTRLPPRETSLAEYDLAGDRPIVLQLAGGFGVGPVEKLLQAILAIDTPLQVVVVAGRNEELRERLETVEPPTPHRLKVLGFTTRMHELMGVADLVVSKPGGLTTSEALACGLPMAIVNPIPGQETRNSDFLLEGGAAVKINHVATLPLKLGRLLRDPDRLATMKRNARALGRPEAAFTIARAALDCAALARAAGGPRPPRQALGEPPA